MFSRYLIESSFSWS